MTFRRAGCSGVLLPAVSLGLWHNFGDTTPLETQRAVLRRAFDLGVTHIDLVNSAKTGETRQRRIDKAIDLFQGGKQR